MTRAIRVLSLGAGVQSSTLALMIARGDIAPVDCAIFADTGWEPKAVYDYLDYLSELVPFPVYRVSSGNIRADTLAKITGKRAASVPWFTLSPKGTKGMVRRQCTSEYKLKPIKRKVVELLGGKRPQGGCEMLIGISTDEAFRVKPSRVYYIINSHPLIGLNMSRRDCVAYLDARKYQPPPKSSCIGCPFHSDAQWRALSPEEFADAVEVDKAIRNQPGLRSQQFMHRACKPLDQIDLSTAEERGQLNLFINECEGLCGL